VQETGLLLEIRRFVNNSLWNHHRQYRATMVDTEHQPVRHGVVGIVVRDGRLLVIRRSMWVEAPGTYCFPGGAIEDGETEAEALRREFREELGVAIEPLRRIWQSRTEWNVQLAWWLVELPQHESLRPHRDEVASTHWLTVDEIRVLPHLLSSNLQFLAALQRGEFSL
jgi:8-oxo-dGTP diphosphatase